MAAPHMHLEDGDTGSLEKKRRRKEEIEKKEEEEEETKAC
jgi:hypothetical protein